MAAAAALGRARAPAARRGGDETARRTHARRAAKPPRGMRAGRGGRAKPGVARVASEGTVEGTADQKEEVARVVEAMRNLRLADAGAVLEEVQQAFERQIENPAEVADEDGESAEEAAAIRAFEEDAQRLLEEVNGPLTHEVDFVVEELLNAVDREERVSIVRANAEHILCGDGIRRLSGLVAHAKDGSEHQARLYLLNLELMDMFDKEPSLAEGREEAFARHRAKRAENQAKAEAAYAEFLVEYDAKVRALYEQEVAAFADDVEQVERAYLNADAASDADKELLVRTCDVFTRRLAAAEPAARKLTPRMLALVDAALPVAPLSDAERDALVAAAEAWRGHA